MTDLVHELDDGTTLTNTDGTPYTTEQRYGFFTGLADHIAKQYKWDRISAYPQVGEQLDMLWHMMDNEIIPGKDSDWYNTILEIKQRYPKP